MPITYYYSDILSYISNLVPRIAESDKAVFVSNLSISTVWKKYDFRQTLETLPPFNLVPGEQDHSSPAVVIPADFLSLRQAYIARLSSTPVWTQTLTCMKDLTLTPLVALPGQICYQPAAASFRVFPRVPLNVGSPDWIVKGEYKKTPVKVTADTLSSTFLPFDDIYFYNLVEVFKWAAWQSVGDQRAGGIQMNKSGAAVFTGQFAVAHEAIDAMASDEGLNLGPTYFAPASPLAVTSMGPSFNTNYNRIFGN